MHIQCPWHPRIISLRTEEDKIMNIFFFLNFQTYFTPNSSPETIIGVPPISIPTVNKILCERTSNRPSRTESRYGLI